MVAVEKIALADGRPQRTQPALPHAHRLHWPTFLIWLPLSLIAAVGVGWLASAAQQYFAPFVLFPLLVGAALAGCLIGLARIIPQGHRRTALCATLLVVAVVVATQHYASFRQWERQATRQDEAFIRAQLAFGQATPQSLPERPTSFAGFMRYQAQRGRPIGSWLARDGWAWATWIGDALLTWAAIAALVAWYWRRPFCNRCRSWFRTTRTGDIEQHTAAELFAICGLRGRGFDNRDWFWYRLRNCRSGCEPTILDLAWRRARPIQQEAAQGHLCVPLDHRQRDRVIADLDRTAPLDARGRSRVE